MFELGGDSILSYIDFKEACYCYPKGSFAVKNISLQFFQDEFTAVTGCNGSGKTTLGKLASGIFKPDRGEVIIDGRSSKLMTLGEIGKKIGYLFQNPDRQIFTSSVYSEIAFTLELKGYTAEEISERTLKMLEVFNMLHLKDSIPFKLSRGEKQRLALAAMLVNDPGFLILDEPTTGLDIERKKILSGIIDKLRDKGIGMLVISHDENFISRHGARIIRMHEGEITDDIR